jgi:hypothetical protein
MMLRAQARPSVPAAGRQVKMRRRTGESETPLGLAGPVMTRSRRWGSREKPYAVAFDVLASDHLSGEMRS